MKELNGVLKQIKGIIESDGKSRIYFKEKDGEILLNDVMDCIVNYWKDFKKEQKENLSNILLKDKPKYLIGNEKWVLYNYICELDCTPVKIEAGNYAYYKIKNMLDDKQETNSYLNVGCTGMLNGEYIDLTKNAYGEKNKVVIYNVELDPKDKKELILYFK